MNYQTLLDWFPQESDSATTFESLRAHNMNQVRRDQNPNILFFRPVRRTRDLCHQHRLGQQTCCAMFFHVSDSRDRLLRGSSDISFSQTPEEYTCRSFWWIRTFFFFLWSLASRGSSWPLLVTPGSLCHIITISWIVPFFTMMTMPHERIYHGCKAISQVDRMKLWTDKQIQGFLSESPVNNGMPDNRTPIPLLMWHVRGVRGLGEDRV